MLFIKIAKKGMVLPLITLLFVSSGFAAGGGHAGAVANYGSDHPQADQDYQNREDNTEYVDQAGFLPYAAPSTVENIYAPQEVVAPAPQAAVPVVPSQQSWVAADNGQVPNGAVVNTTMNANGNSPTFYCRGSYDGENLSGLLIPNDACYVRATSSDPTIRLNSYEVLVGGSA
jgi:hypothetical protein